MGVKAEKWPEQCIFRLYDLVWASTVNFKKCRARITGARLNDYGLLIGRESARHGTTIFNVFFEDGAIEDYFIDDLTLIAPNPDYPMKERSRRTKKWSLINDN